MENEIVAKYKAELDKLGIKFEVLTHPNLKTVEEVQSHLGFGVEDSCPTLIMKAGSDFVAIIKRGDTKIDSKKVKKLLGVADLRLATAEEFTSLTGLPLGTARVFNSGIKTFIDEKVFEKEFLNGGTGSFEVTFRYKTSDLKKIPNSSVANLSESGSTSGIKRVFSGTRATGKLHLGNYLGAVKGYIELQNDSDMETVYMVVDLHAITTPFDKDTLAENTRGIILDYLACGLDPEKSIITAQSLVPEHTYLANLLSTVISVARMQHLPTFKEKVKQHPDNVTMALLNYPVLMAADILAYKASLVPVGIDQEPHLEVAREIARKMNDLYGTDFPEPVRFATKGEYVPSLLGEGKMSKSVEGSAIFIADSLDEIKKKLALAPTDSGKGIKVPTEGGVANLLLLVGLFEGEDRKKNYESCYTNDGIRYSELKVELAEAIFKELKPIQKRRSEIEKKEGYLDKVIREGAERARKIASMTLEETKEKMGIRPL